MGIQATRAEIRKSKTSKLKLETVKAGQEWYVYDFEHQSGKISSRKKVDGLLDPVIQAVEKALPQHEERRGSKWSCKGDLLRGDHPREAPSTLILTGYTPSAVKAHDSVRKARAQAVRDAYLKKIHRDGRVQIVMLKLDSTAQSANVRYFRFSKFERGRFVVTDDTPEKRAKSRAVRIRLGPTKAFTVQDQLKEVKRHYKKYYEQAVDDLKAYKGKKGLSSKQKDALAWWKKLTTHMLQKMIDSKNADDRFYTHSGANYYIIRSFLQTKHIRPGEKNSRVQRMREHLDGKLRCAETRQDFMHDCIKAAEAMYNGMIEPSRIAASQGGSTNHSLTAIVWWLHYRTKQKDSVLNAFDKAGNPPWVSKGITDHLDAAWSKVTGWGSNRSDPENWSSNPKKWPLKVN